MDETTLAERPSDRTRAPETASPLYERSGVRHLRVVTEPDEAAPGTPRTRGKTISVRRLSKAELARGRAEADALLDGMTIARPETRGECEPGGWNAARPCPFVSCKYHLFVEVSHENGAIKMNFPHLEVHELSNSCALDVAHEHRNVGISLEAVGGVMNLTRERIRQIETKAAVRARAAAEELGLYPDD